MDSNCLSTFVETISIDLHFTYVKISPSLTVILVTLLQLNDYMRVALLLDFLFCFVYLSILVSLHCLVYCTFTLGVVKASLLLLFP